jgi:hypothetical protein
VDLSKEILLFAFVLPGLLTFSNCPFCDTGVKDGKTFVKNAL